MSAACRDWLSTLWPASFKGVPFYFESDKEEGGRGLVIHEFPNRDDPFVEDLGEAPRFYSGSAYVHGDNADSLANALKAALASRGAGILVVPYFGPVTVHCQTFERSTQRDQMGYVAFEIKCVREGAASAFASIPLSQNIAFGAAQSIAASLGALFPRSISTLNQPDFVVAAVTDTLAGAAALIDVQRKTYPVDPKVSATLRDTIAGYVGAVPDVITNATAAGAEAGALADVLVGLVRDFADAMPAESAVRASLEFVAAFADPAPATITIAGQPYLSPTAKVQASNASATARLARLAGLIAYAEATLRRTFASRPEGVTARADVAERFEAELYETNGAENAALYVSIEKLRGAVIDWLTTSITNLAPVITVESALIRPSLDLAWILYADPARAPELVARNRVRHPSFMPREISALSR